VASTDSDAQPALGQVRRTTPPQWGPSAADIAPLLPAGVNFSDADAIAAFGRVWSELIGRISGDPWKSSRDVIEEIRKTIPKLLIDIEE
jgi:hypothetical protein